MVEYGQVGIKDVVFKPITSLNAISFGQPYRGVTELSDNLNNLELGIIEVITMLQQIMVVKLD